MFKTSKTLDRIDDMLNRAIKGEDIEHVFDEGKVSRIESKMHKYLMQTGRHRQQLFEEKARVDELISDISHQTKTPLANIMLYSELLAECGSEEERVKYNSLLCSQSKKLNFLIQNLVKASRLENGLISPMPKRQNIANLVSVIKESYPELVVLQKHDDIMSCYDLKWTAEAVENILDNAYKYGAGKVGIEIIRYELYCRIDIKDDGVGISEEDIPRIFTRFYRAQSSQDIAGVGIGLYLARQIISGQGGYIKVKSTLGIGSTFSVYLPL